MVLRSIYVHPLELRVHVVFLQPIGNPGFQAGIFALVNLLVVGRKLLDLNEILVQTLQNGQFYLILKLLHCKEVGCFVRKQGSGVFGKGEEFGAYDRSRR